MLVKNNVNKVMELLFKYPSHEFLLREIARKAKLGNPTVQRILEKLHDARMVSRITGGLYTQYRATTSSQYAILKTAFLRMELLPLITQLEKACQPNCIVLFGSAARGEDTEQSDVDLFVQAQKKSIDMRKAEKRINRTITILFEPDMRTVSKELRNNLANGIVLSGYLEVVS